MLLDHILHTGLTLKHRSIVVLMVTGTITVNDSLDLLAEFMGVKDQVAALTNKASSHLGLFAIQGLFASICFHVGLYNIYASRYFIYDSESIDFGNLDIRRLLLVCHAQPTLMTVATCQPVAACLPLAILYQYQLFSSFDHTVVAAKLQSCCLVRLVLMQHCHACDCAGLCHRHTSKQCRQVCCCG